MHYILEGVTKWLIDKWLSSCNHGCAYYIGTQEKQIDKDYILCLSLGPLWTHALFRFESMNGHLVSMLNSKRKLAEQSIFFHRCCTHYGNAVRQISSSRKNWHNELLKSYFITITKMTQYDTDIHWSVLLLAHSTD